MRVIKNDNRLIPTVTPIRRRGRGGLEREHRSRLCPERVVWEDSPEKGSMTPQLSLELADWIKGCRA